MDLAGMQSMLEIMTQQCDHRDLDGYLDDLRRVFYFQGNVKAAINTAQRQLDLNQQRPWKFYQEFSNYYRYLGDYHTAKCLTQQLDDPGARSRDLSWHEYRWGNFAKATDMQQQGRGVLGWSPVTPPSDVTTWQGQHCGTLVILPEAGMGDRIMYSRWISELRSRADRICFFCISDLDRVLCRNHDVLGIDSWPQASGTICYVPLLSLPAMLDCQTPGSSVYLRADETWIRYNQLQHDKKSHTRIGICASGNATHPENHLRSMRFEDMRDSLSDLGELVCLQPNAPVINGVIYPALEFWEHTLAMIHSCDFVVSVDTAVAHAASAMGKHTVVACNKASYYCWELSEIPAPSKWYSNAWSVTQTQVNQWSDVLDAIREHLSQQR